MSETYASEHLVQYVDYNDPRSTGSLRYLDVRERFNPSGASPEDDLLNTFSTAFDILDVAPMSVRNKFIVVGQYKPEDAVVQQWELMREPSTADPTPIGEPPAPPDPGARTWMKREEWFRGAALGTILTACGEPENRFVMLIRQDVGGLLFLTKLYPDGLFDDVWSSLDIPELAAADKLQCLHHAIEGRIWFIDRDPQNLLLMRDANNDGILESFEVVHSSVYEVEYMSWSPNVVWKH